VYIKSGASAQIENIRELSRKEQGAKLGIQFMVNVGDAKKCPECETIGSVVWVSQDKKTMGVKCPRSHREAIRPESKFGATVIPSTKNRKNVVFLTSTG
jgi:hypothetical protein